MAPNAVPDMKSNRPPLSIAQLQQYYKKQQLKQQQQKMSTPLPTRRNPPNYTPISHLTAATPKPESSSFWPGFLDFFSGGSSSSSTSSSSESTGRPSSLKPIQGYTQDQTRLPIHQTIQQLPFNNGVNMQGPAGINTKQKNQINNMHMSNKIKGKNKPFSVGSPQKNPG